MSYSQVQNGSPSRRCALNPRSGGGNGCLVTTNGAHGNCDSMRFVELDRAADGSLLARRSSRGAERDLCSTLETYCAMLGNSDKWSVRYRVQLRDDETRQQYLHKITNPSSQKMISTITIVPILPELVING